MSEYLNIKLYLISMLTGSLGTSKFLNSYFFFFYFRLGIGTQCYYYNKKILFIFSLACFLGLGIGKVLWHPVVTYITALLAVFYCIVSMQRMILVAWEHNGHQVQPVLKAGVAAEVNQVTHGLILPSSEKLPGRRSHSFALQLSLRGVTSAGILRLVLAIYCLFMAYPDPVLFKTSL